MERYRRGEDEGHVDPARSKTVTPGPHGKPACTRRRRNNRDTGGTSPIGRVPHKCVPPSRRVNVPNARCRVDEKRYSGSVGDIRDELKALHCADLLVCMLDCRYGNAGNSERGVKCLCIDMTVPVHRN